MPPLPDHNMHGPSTQPPSSAIVPSCRMGSANNRPNRVLAQPMGPQWRETHIEAEKEKQELGRVKKEREVLEMIRGMTHQVHVWHTVRLLSYTYFRVLISGIVRRSSSRSERTPTNVA